MDALDDRIRERLGVEVDDLTQRVHSGPRDVDSPFTGEHAYESLFDQLARALHRRTRRHAFLVADPGVGQRIFLAEFAGRVVDSRYPGLAHSRILTVECRRLMPEVSREVLLRLFSEFAAQPSAIVVVDGFGGLLRGPGGTTNGPLLLSLLERAQCRFVALVSPTEYEELAASAGCEEFFEKLEMFEPSSDLALRIAMRFARGLELQFSLKIEAEAVRQAVELSAAYILNRRLPAKSLDLLLRACEDVDYDRRQGRVEATLVKAADIVRTAAGVVGVSEATLSGIGEDVDFGRLLRESIFGQEEAVSEVAAEFNLIQAGMSDRGKPASVMLFVGQTGTGKTELAKTLARLYSASKRLKVYTLGNFVESHSVSGIIGVPAGYVGNDQGGRIVNELNADPYGVFLLDEVDKAHPDVVQPFLNLFDEGWVADHRGRRAHADRAVFILTTNVGQRMIGDMASRGESAAVIGERVKESLTQIKHSKGNRPVFTPEFVARIKRVVVFQPLDARAMNAIAGKLSEELCEEWRRRRGKSLDIAAELVSEIGGVAHHKNDKSQGKEGGRIVRKLLAQFIQVPLQQAIARDTAGYRRAAGAVVRWRRPARAAATETDDSRASGEAMASEEAVAESALNANDVVVHWAPADAATLQ